MESATSEKDARHEGVRRVAPNRARIVNGGQLTRLGVRPDRRARQGPSS